MLVNPSSCLPQDLAGNEMKLKLWLSPFSLICIQFSDYIGFGIFNLWVNHGLLIIVIYADTVTVWLGIYIGSFQIPYLGSCPLSTDLKVSLISLARPVPDFWSVWYGDWFFFQIQFRQGSKVCKYHSQTGHYWLCNFIRYRGQKVSPHVIVQKVCQLTHLFHHHLDSALQWLDL